MIDDESDHSVATKYFHTDICGYNGAKDCYKTELRPETLKCVPAYIRNVKRQLIVTNASDAEYAFVGLRKPFGPDGTRFLNIGGKMYSGATISTGVVQLVYIRLDSKLGRSDDYARLCLAQAVARTYHLVLGSTSALEYLSLWYDVQDVEPMMTDSFALARIISMPWDISSVAQHHHHHYKPYAIWESNRTRTREQTALQCVIDNRELYMSSVTTMMTYVATAPLWAVRIFIRASAWCDCSNGTTWYELTKAKSQMLK